MALVVYIIYTAGSYVARGVGWNDVWTAVRYGFYTLTRVVVLIVISSLVWVPLGILIGLRPRLAEKIQPLAQFLAAFPANLLFPVFVVGIVYFKANPDIWLSPLIVLGTQWYILFNIIAGATAFPTDLREAATNFRVRRWQWWRDVMLPGVFPYFITGAITASGGAWNASIIAEYFRLKDVTYTTVGLGATISRATDSGNFALLLGSTVVMAMVVVTINRLVWRRMYRLAANRYTLET